MIIDPTLTETERKLKRYLELKQWINSTVTDMLMSMYEEQGKVLAAEENEELTK